MVLLVRMEDIRLACQAERLVQKPRRPFRIDALPLVVRFVAAARERTARPQTHREAELLRLRGPDVEKRHRMPHDLAGLAVGDAHDMQGAPDLGGDLCTQ